MSYCQNCGAQAQPNDKYCPSCGANMQSSQPNQNFTQQNQNFAQPQMGNQFYPPQVNIDNHLAKAIFSTICCCIPLGIVSIVFSGQVKGKIAAGDYQGAQDSANKADLWSNISIGVGFVVILIQIIIGLASSRF
jgi:uncharacterized membrane protein YvbJ